MSSKEMENELLNENSNIKSTNWDDITDDISFENKNSDENSKSEIMRTKEILINTSGQDIQLESIDGMPTGSYDFYRDFMDSKRAQELLEYLKENIDWVQRDGKNKSGAEYKEPRFTCWFGKPYTYSSVKWDSKDKWDPKLEELKEELQKFADPNRKFNSVMCNYYKDGSHSIGWHADDEASLGQDPVIASISLGDIREFLVCRRDEYYNRAWYNGESYEGEIFAGCSNYYEFELTPGSLLIMKGPMQDYWLHSVPKIQKPASEMVGRINLTFRYIVDEDEEKKEVERQKELRKQRKIKQNEKYDTQQKNYYESGYNIDKRQYDNKMFDKNEKWSNDNQRYRGRGYNERGASGRKNNNEHDNLENSDRYERGHGDENQRGNGGGHDRGRWNNRRGTSERRNNNEHGNWENSEKYERGHGDENQRGNRGGHDRGRWNNSRGTSGRRNNNEYNNSENSERYDRRHDNENQRGNRGGYDRERWNNGRGTSGRRNYNEYDNSENSGRYDRRHDNENQRGNRGGYDRGRWNNSRGIPGRRNNNEYDNSENRRFEREPEYQRDTRDRLDYKNDREIEFNQRGGSSNKGKPEYDQDREREHYIDNKTVGSYHEFRRNYISSVNRGNENQTEEGSWRKPHSPNDQKIATNDYKRFNERKDYKDNQNPRNKRYEERKNQLITERKLIDNDTDNGEFHINNEVCGNYIWNTNFLNEDQAEELFKYLMERIPWDTPKRIDRSGEAMFELPRLSFYFGKKYFHTFETKGDEDVWDSKLERLREELQKFADPDKPFNSVMCNFFKNHDHRIGWHADDDDTLGQDPVIATVSLGNVRKINICDRDEYFLRTDYYNNYFQPYKNELFPGCSMYYEFNLNPGSLLIMKGSTQDNLMHRVPRIKNEDVEYSGHIQLTFRYVVDEDEEEKEKERKIALRKKQFSAQNKKFKDIERSYYGRSYYNYKDNRVGGQNRVTSNKEHDYNKFDRRQEQDPSIENDTDVDRENITNKLGMYSDRDEEKKK